MTNYSIQQIKSVGQPPEVLNRRVAEHWSGPLYMRKISPYVSKVLLKLGISPTVVTWLMVLSGWLAAASVIRTGLSGVILAVVFAQLQMLFNKVFNDMVHVARSFSNLAKLSEDKSVAVPRNKIVALIRSLFRFFPIHKIYHSVELSIIFLLAAIFDFLSETLILLTLAAAITVIGHLVAILTSSRLRA